MKNPTPIPYKWLVFLATAKLLVHFFTNGQYGFHRDEFLYIALGEHLAWGFAEIPPSIAIFANISRNLLGDTIFAIRFFPAMVGAAGLIFTALIARELGGGKFAQVLTGLVFLMSPAYLGSNTLFQPVSFNQFYWILSAYILLRWINHQNPHTWIHLGIAMGLAMLNKYSVLLFAFGIFVGLLLHPIHRKAFQSKWLYLGVLTALLIWLPNLIWQTAHDFPELTHLQELSDNQLAHVNVFDFLISQLLMQGLNCWIVLLGLGYLLLSPKMQSYRILAWIFLSIIVVLLLLSGKDYYSLGAYPMLIAAGALAIEVGTKGNNWRKWLRPALIIWVLLCNLFAIPYVLPILPVAEAKSYMLYMADNYGLDGPIRWEDGERHDLTQDYADMHGWGELVELVAYIYQQIPESERSETAIYAGNYGQAGAINWYGKQYGLPKAHSRNSSYLLWWDDSLKPKNLIVVDNRDSRADFAVDCEAVELATQLSHPIARENGTHVFLCRGLKVGFEDW
ncbi:MAG: glycosyltransferase family 39 protein [Chitinophagales bacterium]